MKIKLLGVVTLLALISADPCLAQQRRAQGRRLPRPRVTAPVAESAELKAARAALSEANGLRASRDTDSMARAAQKYREAAEGFAASRRRFEAEQAFTESGRLYEALGRTQEAAAAYERASELQHAALNFGQESITRRSLGRMYLSLGNYRDALRNFEESLLLKEVLNERAGLAETAINLAQLYIALGDKNKAAFYLRRGLPIKESLYDNVCGQAEGGMCGAILHNIGVIYLNLGSYEQALDVFEKARSILQADADRRALAQTMTSIGETKNLLGESADAAMFENALKLWEEVGDVRGEAVALTGLGVALLKGRKLSDAMSYLDRAARKHMDAGNIEGQAHTFHHLMLAWKQASNKPLAIYYGKLAVDGYQDIRRNIVDLDSQLQNTYIKSKEETYRVLAGLLIEEGRFLEAEQILKLLKGEEFKEFVGRDEKAVTRLLVRPDLTDDERKTLTEFRQYAADITSAASEFRKLKTKGERSPQDEEQFREATKKLEIANQSYQIFLSKLVSDFAKLTGKRGESSRAEQLRNASLQSDLKRWSWSRGSVVLYTIMGEDKYRVVLTTPDTQTWGESDISAQSLNDLVWDFRRALQDSKIDPRAAGKKLYDVLLGPVADDLAKLRPQTLVWSLDGALRYLSPAALHDGSQYLAERYEHVIITLASRTRLPDERSPDWRGAAFGVSIIPDNLKYLFDPLPAVRDELQSVIREAGEPAGDGVIPGVTALNPKFTKAAFESALARPYPVIHIASHFAIKAGGDKTSYLLLGDGEQLSLETIRTSPVISFENVDLLTLSACNTGVGFGDKQGSEVEGFAMIAQERGAKAIIASLWSVPDPSTAQLMRAFYEAAAREGLTKAAALRRAQLALLQPGGKVRAPAGPGNGGDATPAPAGTNRARQPADPSGRERFTPDPRARYAHPYFWAPFVLIGNWR